jgi:hypothetical protein
MDAAAVEMVCIVAYLLEAGIVELEKQPSLGNGCSTRNNGVIVGSGVFRAVRARGYIVKSGGGESVRV